MRIPKGIKPISSEQIGPNQWRTVFSAEAWEKVSARFAVKREKRNREESR